MNNLAAHEFTLRSQASNRREFLLNFCQDDIDAASSDLSESEIKEDFDAMKAGYKSLQQAALRKKLLAINAQPEQWEFEFMT